MSGKLIAHKLESQRSSRLIVKKDGSAIFWVCQGGRKHKQTVAPIPKEEIEGTIKSLGLQPVEN